MVPRRRSRRILFLVTCILSFLLYETYPLIQLLPEDGNMDSISASQLFKEAEAYEKPDIIPKIIHQTYKNTSIPLRWQQMLTMILQYHSDYEYMFWTDQTALEFISTHYSAYLQSYTSYAHPIQRADALRYFVLYHFGGIYLDLDITPYQRLDPLLTLPAFACLTTPTGISNDALGSTPGHPFFLHVINSLQKYNRNWGSPYITIMSSTGPLFLSLVWKQWLDSGRNVGNGRVRALVPEGRGYGFFVNVEGRSWQGRDEKIVEWFERHWIFDIALAIGVVIVSSMIVLWFLEWASRKGHWRRWMTGVRGVWEIKGWRRGDEFTSFV